MRDLLALADLVVSRSGANSIFEYLALAKPMVLIPLVHGSRGDQIDNAKCFVVNGWAKSLDETKASAKDLQEAVHEVFSDDSMAKALLEEKSKGLLSEHVVLDRLESFSEVPVKAYEKS